MSTSACLQADIFNSNEGHRAGTVVRLDDRAADTPPNVHYTPRRSSSASRCLSRSAMPRSSRLASAVHSRRAGS